LVIKGRTNKDWINTTTLATNRKGEQTIMVYICKILHVRVIKVELSTGETEILLTNLSKKELSQEESQSLYFRRWGLETRLDILKHTFQMENFSTENPQLMEQDYHATIWLSNLASLFEQDAEEEMCENHRTQTLKYREYQIHQNVLVGKLRNRLIEMAIEEDNTKKDLLYARFVKEIQPHIVPVVKNRSFPRIKKTKANKFEKTKRRGV